VLTDNGQIVIVYIPNLNHYYIKICEVKSRALHAKKGMKRYRVFTGLSRWL
jgi:hypothetical protein